jgi:outer membrane immunogenic protein
MLHRITMASAGLIALAGSAFAADLPVKAPPMPAPPPAYSWSGFYVGGQVGWARVNDDGSIVNPGIPFPPPINIPFTVNTSGVIGGGHAGFNWQHGMWVFGLEGSVDGANLSKSFQVGICPLFCGAATTKIGLQESVRGRLGVAFDRVLIYGTGGVAFANITNTYDTTAFGGGDASIGGVRTGWTAGAGFGFAVTNEWFLLAEYRHSDFGNVVDKSSVAFFPATNLNRHVTEDQVQLGVSLKLGN